MEVPGNILLNAAVQISKHVHPSHFDVSVLHDKKY